MRCFNYSELQHLLPLFQTYTGAQLQDVQTSEKGVQLSFYLKEKSYFLWYMQAASPLFLIHDRPFKMAKKTKPLQLFLKKYFVGHRLLDVRLGEGRVLYFDFQSVTQKSCIELRLFPHGQNIIAMAEGKQMSWAKPKELVSSSSKLEPVDIPARQLMQIKVDEFLQVKPKVKKAKPQKTKQQIISELENSAKDTKRIAQLEQDIALLASQSNMDLIYPKYKLEGDLPWYEALNFLKEKLAKERGKKAKIQERIKELKKQERRQSEVQPKSQPLSSKHLLLEGGKRAFLGKSAKENAELLRKAKPWYLWAHIRGLPSAHIIVEKNKKQNLSQSELHEIANWLVANSSLAKKAQSGDHFELQYTECRYLRKIKGAPAGQVQVMQEKVLRFQLP
tara:strand:- start:4280 stop:5452 length:1173 start_codon:yes stop_codon:yes gene_type:complete